MKYKLQRGILKLSDRTPSITIGHLLRSNNAGQRLIVSFVPFFFFHSFHTRNPWEMEFYDFSLLDSFLDITWQHRHSFLSPRIGRFVRRFTVSDSILVVQTNNPSTTGEPKRIATHRWLVPLVLGEYLLNLFGILDYSWSIRSLHVLREYLLNLFGILDYSWFIRSLHVSVAPCSSHAVHRIS